jgi:hypothetical protein
MRSKWVVAGFLTLVVEGSETTIISRPCFDRNFSFDAIDP